MLIKLHELVRQKVVVETSNREIQSTLCPAEEWFEHLAEGLRLIVPTLPAVQVMTALETHLPKRVERVLPRLQNPEDAEEWLRLILKSSFLIHLWQSTEKPTLVALSVTGSAKSAKDQMHLIKSPEFRAARMQLGIDKHWFLVIPGLSPVSPSKDELLDALYEQLQLEAECSLIAFSTS